MCYQVIYIGHLKKMPIFKKICSCMPQRWLIATLAFFAFFNAYTLRICLSMAITKMTVPLNSTEKTIDETCPEFDDKAVKSNVTIHGGTFEWSEYTQGIILSSFYWGYVCTHIPGGFLAAKYGAKSVLGLGILFTGLCTIATPAATQTGGAKALIFIRFLMGAFEGVIQPGMSCLLAQWIPSGERSFVSSFVYSGIRLGILISSIVSGMIMSKGNSWPWIFYAFGGMTIIWYLFWVIFCHNNPRESPYISEEEKNYLLSEMEKDTHEEHPPFPWKRALTSKAFLATIIMQTGHDFSTYTILSDLPKFMHDVLKLPVQLTGYASSMHNISAWLFGTLMSWVSDKLIIKNYVSITNVRKINVFISSLGPGVMLVLATYMGCNVVGAVALITIGLTLTGSSIPGLKVNVLDLSPNYAGELMGISNGMGAFMGILAPYVVGVLTPNQTFMEWRLIFWIGTIIYLVATLNFIIFGSGDVQKWNDLPSEKSKKFNKESVKLIKMQNIRGAESQ
ncbi:putative inorganic phosphate cotransporter [Trichogramma pretiosum]|uniref:putative inorganic phosphate cotransporter n=1 Tax=Trichogramma pretiosum TaxID=7493 RepID=UPI0006C94804|nr:putative inorganic phosphate cotransporter [Trichogramma pretiosum]